MIDNQNQQKATVGNLPVVKRFSFLGCGHRHAALSSLLEREEEIFYFHREYYLGSSFLLPRLLPPLRHHRIHYLHLRRSRRRVFLFPLINPKPECRSSRVPLLFLIRTQKLKKRQQDLLNNNNNNDVDHYLPFLSFPFLSFH